MHARTPRDWAIVYRVRWRQRVSDGLKHKNQAVTGLEAAERIRFGVAKCATEQKLKVIGLHNDSFDAPPRTEHSTRHTVGVNDLSWPDSNLF